MTLSKPPPICFPTCVRSTTPAQRDCRHADPARTVSVKPSTIGSPAPPRHGPDKDLPWPSRPFACRAPSSHPTSWQRLSQIVGAKNAITDPLEQEAYLVEERGLYRGHTPLVLRPGSVAEVAAILRLANETSTPIVPQGGNTGLVGGQVPHNGEVLLSLKRLDQIREVDATSNTMTCEAGVILAKAQEAAAHVDRLFPLSLGAEGSCTIGGNLSTNAGGTGALAYGVARDLVLGLEVVLADGQIWHGLNKLKKDNTGYDLRHLFLGAEGTLGVITAAVLKLYPRPRAVETAFVGVPSPRAAIALLNLVQERTGGAATSFELIKALALEFALRHGHGVRDPLPGKHPWYVLLQLSSQTAGLRGIMEEVLAAAAAARSCRGRDHRGEPRPGEGVLAHSRNPARSAKARGRVGQARRVRADRAVAGVPRASRRRGAEAHPRRAHRCRSAMPATATSTTTSVSRSAPTRTRSWPAGTRSTPSCTSVVAKLGGSISAEHGIGVMKRDLLPGVKDPVALELMRTLKRTLDPNNILNPGKVV